LQVVGCQLVAGDRNTTALLVEIGIGVLGVASSPARPCLVFLASGNAEDVMPFLSEHAELVLVHGPEAAARRLLACTSTSCNFAAFLPSSYGVPIKAVQLTSRNSGPVWLTGTQHRIETMLKSFAKYATEPNRCPTRKPRLCDISGLPEGAAVDNVSGLEAIEDFFTSLDSVVKSVHEEGRFLQRIFAAWTELDFDTLKHRGAPAGDVRSRMSDLQGQMQKHVQQGSMAPPVALLIHIMTNVRTPCSCGFLLLQYA
jgi:hypothetical protein